MNRLRTGLVLFAAACCLLTGPQVVSSLVDINSYTQQDVEVSLRGASNTMPRFHGRRSMLRALEEIEHAQRASLAWTAAGARRSLTQASSPVPAACESGSGTSTKLTLKFAACCPETVGASASDLAMNTSRIHIEYQLPGGDWTPLNNVLNYPAINGDRTYARIVGESATLQTAYPQVPQCAAVRMYVDTANAATEEIWNNADFSQPVWETQYAVPDSLNASTLVLPVCPAAWYSGCAVSANVACKMPNAYCPDLGNVDAAGNWIVPPSLNGAPPPATASSPMPPTVAQPVPSPGTTVPAPSKSSSSSTVGIAIGVALGAIALIALALLAVFLRRRSRSRAAGALEVSTSPGVSTSARAELLPDDAEAIAFPKPKGDLGPLVNAEIPFSSNSRIRISQLLMGGSQYSSTVTVTGSGYGSGLHMESGEQPSDSDVLRAAESQLQDAQRTIGGHHLNSVVMTSSANGGHATISSGWDTEWHPDELYAQVQKMVFARQKFAGKYTMSGEVIVGGQGCVVFATAPNPASHTGEVMEVAIKFHFNLETFTNEAQLVENEELEFHLPQVVEISRNVHNVQAPNGKTFPPYIVLPRGEPLDFFIRSKRPDSLHCVMILIHLAEKLAAMHAAGLVHRDVKPANSIWLPVEHEWNLIDFGCAAPIGLETQLMFTPRYAPPEIIQAAMSQARTMVVEASVDVWALGVVAYQLLTGSTALSTMKAEELFAALQGKSPLPWEQDNQVSFNVAKDFAEIILQMLARDPSQRPSMQEVVDGWRRVTGIGV